MLDRQAITPVPPWQRFLCRIGLHRWEMWGNGPVAFMICPWPGMRWIRCCRFCQVECRWLPGYGGSEVGFWIRVRR